ncbi:MAG TPA: hypothetical protein VHO70_08990 [Chitinispirillaceae bacterium]|nr:hypothetical protein [Chitinispirillaceae bacterium]
MKHITLLILVTFQVSFAMGFQRGIFRCQATQGKQWWGESSIVSEHFTIKVMPSYIDVTLDWELDCKGTTVPDSFKDVIEIVGNINLAQDAAVTGLLLWNGDEILKAKLKPLPLARKQYETVVDRNVVVPPRPKDPLILEYGWGKDNYDIKIFPVSLGKTRRLRLRYVVPAINTKGCADIPFPSPFNASVATYTIALGPGVSNFKLLNTRFDVLSEKAELTATSDGELLKQARLIRPVIENPDSASVIYTAPINTPSLSGTLIHFTGQTAEAILKKTSIREDIVFLWRWSHPDYFEHYKKQIVIQAGLLRKFFTNIANTGRQAGLVVDIEGKDTKVFPIDKSGSTTVKEIIAFLDSLCTIKYTESNIVYNPNFTLKQQDSIVSLSISEFISSLRLAESLFEQKKTIMRKVVFLTAGPCWVYQLKAHLDLEWTTTATLTCFTGIESCDELKSVVIPPEARGFYWPGINMSTINFNQTMIEVVLKLGEIRHSIFVPFTQNSSFYSWDYCSPYHDVLLFANGNVSPEIVWNVYHNGGNIATLTEKAVLISEMDPSQFGASLAGTGRLKAFNTSLPSSLAPAFGFVDQRYALLALEEDVMSPEDQAQYRNQGVPPLTNADILNLPVDSVPPKEGNFGQIQVPVNPKYALKPPHVREQPSVTYCKSVLTIQFNSEASKASSEAVIEIYSLSGALLYTVKNVKVMDGVTNCRLPALNGSSQKMVVVKVRCGKVTFSRVVSIW